MAMFISVSVKEYARLLACIKCSENTRERCANCGMALDPDTLKAHANRPSAKAWMSVPVVCEDSKQGVLVHFCSAGCSDQFQGLDSDEEEDGTYNPDYTDYLV